MKMHVSYARSDIQDYFFKIACTSINYTSLYKTRNPLFDFLPSIVLLQKNKSYICFSSFFYRKFVKGKKAIVRKKHVSIMDTRKVTQYGFLILL